MAILQAHMLTTSKKPVWRNNVMLPYAAKVLAPRGGGFLKDDGIANNKYNFGFSSPRGGRTLDKREH